MFKINIRPATSKDIGLIRSIAEQTWPSTYGTIISQAQINFMLDWMYSDASLIKQMEEGHSFFIASVEQDGQNESIGFCSVCAANPDEFILEENILKSIQYPSHKLNKLYVLPKAQGTGAGSALLNKAIELAKLAKASSLFLQVNKQNNACAFYQKKGFVQLIDCKFDIGNGFFMDDYIMYLMF